MLKQQNRVSKGNQSRGTHIAQAPANLGDMIFSGQDGPHVQMFMDLSSWCSRAQEKGEDFDPFNLWKVGFTAEPRGEMGDPSRAQFAKQLAQVAANQSVTLRHFKNEWKMLAHPFLKQGWKNQRCRL